MNVNNYGIKFGKAYTRNGKSDNWREFKESKIDNTRLFTGREYDKDIGLNYYRARYYSPELGRFISRDPIGQVDDVNLYGYVGNNPVMGVDPSGEAKQMIGNIGYKILISIFIVESTGDDGSEQFYKNRAEGDVYNIVLGGASLAKYGIKKIGTKTVEDFSDDAARILEETKAKYPYTEGVYNMAGGNGRYISPKTKDLVREQSGNICVYCGIKTNISKNTNPSKSEIDHIEPFVKSKNNDISNLQNTCRTCNRKKGTKSDSLFKSRLNLFN